MLRNTSPFPRHFYNALPVTLPVPPVYFPYTFLLRKIKAATRFLPPPAQALSFCGICESAPSYSGFLVKFGGGVNTVGMGGWGGYVFKETDNGLQLSPFSGPDRGGGGLWLVACVAVFSPGRVNSGWA